MDNKSIETTAHIIFNPPLIEGVIQKRKSQFTMLVEIDSESIQWDSSNWEVVAIDGDGVIAGISPGTAEITATVSNVCSGVYRRGI